MPAFILDKGDADSAREFNQLDSFTQGYIEAMFFTDASDPDDGELSDATFADLHPDSLKEIIRECAEFQSANAELLERAYDMGYAQGHYDAERAGNDFWYTRNGHGTGFWDRDLGEVGDKLAKISRYRSVDLYMGDDGFIHV
jgi:hypothetical protein